MVEKNNAADLPAAEIQKKQPKETEKNFQQTAITSYLKK